MTERNNTAADLSARRAPRGLDQEQQEAREAALDETLAATFPASDPLSSDPDPAPDETEWENWRKIAS